MDLSIALIGNPNCGKTTLFNALTGARQQVANWPGVTVERKSGFFEVQQQKIEVTDLPGIYSLVGAGDGAFDERIACEFILSRQVDWIINVVDAEHLERHLYLTTQLLDMGVPIILVLNKMDLSRARNRIIDCKKLEKKLGCPVLTLEAHKRKGLEALKAHLLKKPHVPRSKTPYPPFLEEAIRDITALTKDRAIAIRLLEGDEHTLRPEDLSIQQAVKRSLRQIEQHFGEEADILLADARYQFIQKILLPCVIKKVEPGPTWSSRLDRLVLNRFLGIPIFLGVMYSLFLFAINIGGAFQDFFDIGSDTLLVSGLAHGLDILHAPTWLIALLAYGVGKGINTTLTFIPVIGALFFALAFLEESGYMARAAFVVDRLMRVLGLPGKSFVPMIVGFGCNVPAVMGARVLDNKRDRILTVMMSPFMSCSARLAIYAVFIAAFFPKGGQNIVFALYLIGIFLAMLTGGLLRQTLLKGESAPLVMELPPYQFPQLKTLWSQMWRRLRNFVFRAGKLIVPICVLLGALNTLNVDGSLNQGEGDRRSILSVVGQGLTPFFTPMGIEQENWPATVGLVTGILAKEVVVGTLNTLYSQLGHLNVSGDVFDFWGGLKDALVSIPTNFSQMGAAFSNPILAKAPLHTLDQSVYGLMAERFDGKVGALAYLLFVLLYFPCVSTIAVVSRELGQKWATFSVVWTTLVAYSAAVGFYQAATWSRHPLASLAWLLGIGLVLLFVVLALRAIALDKKSEETYELIRH